MKLVLCLLLSICAIDELFLGLEFPKVETGCSLKEILVDCTQLGFVWIFAQGTNLWLWMLCIFRN